MKFYIEVRRVIRTEIEIEAPNATVAREAVKDYGPTEAANDFKVVSESVQDFATLVRKI